MLLNLPQGTALSSALEHGEYSVKDSPFSLVTTDKVLAFEGLAYRNQIPGLLSRNSVSQLGQVNVPAGFLNKNYKIH